VDLAFDDQLTQITARTDISVEVLSQNLAKIDLDFGDMPIDSVLVSGTAAKFERTPEMLNVILATAAKRGDKLNVTVNYHGHPQNGLIFAKDGDGKISATGDNWPNRVHYWIRLSIIRRRKQLLRLRFQHHNATKLSPTEIHHAHGKRGDLALEI